MKIRKWYVQVAVSFAMVAGMLAGVMVKPMAQQSDQPVSHGDAAAFALGQAGLMADIGRDALQSCQRSFKAQVSDMQSKLDQANAEIAKLKGAAAPPPK